ncbi:putative transcriptional regulator [Brevibacillus phage Sundance]|uniref:putative transcriptional regulator n=1 Tax=Brevibacillus phage Sundance TaxID=1691958 RepID=UPI0006BDE718|nr:putative transcriptional regulator [Brevibacillus phage Sundance]ALA47971.1 putative transcriptional regulator [Brevibacillus phage Sundance]
MAETLSNKHLSLEHTRTEKEQRRQEFGMFVKNLRKQNYKTIEDVAKHIGVSINFISLIERGQKQPSDLVISGYAEYFGVDEILLYEKLDKLSPHIKNTLKEHSGFKKLVSELLVTVDNPELRQELYEEVYNVYKDFLDRHNITKE